MYIVRGATWCCEANEFTVTVLLIQNSFDVMLMLVGSVVSWISHEMCLWKAVRRYTPSCYRNIQESFRIKLLCRAEISSKECCFIAAVVFPENKALDGQCICQRHTGMKSLYTWYPCRCISDSDTSGDCWVTFQPVYFSPRSAGGIRVGWKVLGICISPVTVDHSHD